MVRGLQERAARALPADHVEHVGGWWLRHSASSSWWTGTVLPHGDADRGELVPMIAAAERFYSGFEEPTSFQISPGACPSDLDATLAQRGYRRHSPMSLQTASSVDVRAQASPDQPSIRLSGTPTTAWFDVWYAVHGHGSDPQRAWDMLHRVTGPTAYVSALEGDDVIAVARAVADTGWAGVFGMASLPDRRRTGAARGILASVADWATGHGADGLYLQVETDNDPALRLYDSASFTELCRYHYRSATGPDAELS